MSNCHGDQNRTLRHHLRGKWNELFKDWSRFITFMNSIWLSSVVERKQFTSPAAPWSHALTSYTSAAHPHQLHLGRTPSPVAPRPYALTSCTSAARPHQLHRAMHDSFSLLCTQPAILIYIYATRGWSGFCMCANSIYCKLSC